MGPPIEKAHTLMKKKTPVKTDMIKIDTSGYIINAWAIHRSHTDWFVSKRTVFRYSAAYLSVIFSYFLIQLIPFASKWDAG